MFDPCRAGSIALAAIATFALFGCSASADGDDEIFESAESISTTSIYRFGTLTHAGSCLDVAAGSRTDGARVQEWTCNGTGAQAFRFTSLGGGYYEVVNPQSGKCLDAAAWGTANGTKIQLWACHGGANQAFRITGSTGHYQLVGKQSGKCVDVAGAATANGTQVQLWTCNGTHAQAWKPTVIVGGGGGGGGGSGTGAIGGGSVDAGAAGGGGTAGNFPARFAAPYVETWNDNDLAALAGATGHKFYTLAFVINGSGACEPTWNGYEGLTANRYGGYIDALRKVGGDVIVSFGGASGTELGQACGSVASLRAAYQKVIDQFHLTWLDFDVESGAESDATSVDRRNKAIRALQSANPGLHVSYTLAVDRSGLPSAQLALLRNAQANGARVDVVNVMAMDYGPCYGDMGQASVDAGENTRKQLASNGLSASVGVTPMIGKNDVACEVFSIKDAQILTAWAQTNPAVRTLGFWAIGADPGHGYLEVFHGLR